LNRRDLQHISKIRREEAITLLKPGHYAGAYYLAGYSIECAIKACIAKQIKCFEFPDKDLANKAWSHDLGNLIGIAGLARLLQADMKVNRNLEINWAIVKDWNESSRYEISITKSQASDYFSACFDKIDGIYYWIKKRW
jgi:HEPN domain-containing protein